MATRIYSSFFLEERVSHTSRKVHNELQNFLSVKRCGTEDASFTYSPYIYFIFSSFVVFSYVAYIVNWRFV